MLIGAELINDNGISSVALAFFTALLGAVSATVIGIVQLKSRANEAKDAALTAAEKAQETVENTQNVANGFTRRVDTKLDTIARNQEELGTALREHIQWHLEKRE